MNVLFQNPLWLLLPLVAVPLLAHLFSRTRPRTRDFPSLRLLREAMRRVTRVRRPRDRWLLLLRTLAIAALVAAFLQPWLLSRFAGKGNAARTVVIIVDATASMGFADGTRTRLAQATAAAEDVLATLPAGSRANLVWLRAHAESALPEPGPNLDFLRLSLRQAGVQAEPGDLAGALALAVKQLATAEGDRELVICSDFQASAWRKFDVAVPPSIRVTRVAAGAGDAANTGLAGLALEPARPVAGQDARLVCRVRNFSGEPRRVTVFAEAGESRLSQAVEIAPWSETLAIMPVKFPAEGLVPLKATLSEDRFPGDDTRFALVEVRGALQVAVAGPADDATARTWLRAAQALDGVAARRVSLDDFSGGADVLLLAGWNGANRETLRAHLERGGALALQPATGLDPAALRELLQLGPGQPLADERHEGWSLRIASEDHPVFALFAGGAFGDPAGGKFRHRWSAPAFPAGARTLLAYDDGRPALTLFDISLTPAAALNSQLSTLNSRSTIAWWNLDLAATDWPARAAFVPFFGEFLRHLALRAGTGTLHTFEPGEPLRLDAGAAVDPKIITLLNDADQPVPLAAESPRAPQRLVTTAPPPPGSYRWLAHGGVLDRAVINFPESESDLRQLTAAELAQAGGTVVTDAARARLAGMREGRPLWPWCLAFAALCLLAEGVCLRLFRVRAETVATKAGSVAAV